MRLWNSLNIFLASTATGYRCPFFWLWAGFHSLAFLIISCTPNSVCFMWLSYLDECQGCSLWCVSSFPIWRHQCRLDHARGKPNRSNGLCLSLLASAPLPHFCQEADPATLAELASKSKTGNPAYVAWWKILRGGWETHHNHHDGWWYN